MFQAPKSFVYDKMDTTKNLEYKIRQGDIFSMQVLSNNGYALVDVVGFNGSFLPIDYNVHQSGYAILPLLDSFYVSGLTAAQLEDSLSIKYSYYFINPFIRINVKTKRVFVFTGRNLSKDVELKKDNMTLVEVLATAGSGLSFGKAKKIKVIRGSGANAKVYLFDLSTIEGFKNADFLILGNDIIYVEPIKGPQAFYSTIAPVISIITSALFIYTVFITGR